jgi:biopolymer transport protein ExbD
MTRVFCAILCGLAIALVSLGCGKTEPAGLALPKPTQARPTTARTTTQEPAKPPQTTREPTAQGPAVLTLRATGALVDPDGQPLALPDDTEAFLKKERAQLKEPRTIFRAERQADIFRVCSALALYRKAGFREVELQEAANTAKKGPILTLSDLAKAKEGDDTEPARITEEQPRLPIRMHVVVHANGSGSQAGDVRDMVFKTVTGEVGLARGKWREGLPKAIRSEDSKFYSKDSCEIEADPKLTYGAVLEVIEMCSSAGIKRIELSILGGKRSD